MLKRVIFDIDNTLIPWKQEYFNEVYNTLEELNIECTDMEFNEIIKAFAEYENTYYVFNKELMINYINEYTGKKYPKEFIDKIIDRWSRCVPEKLPESTIKTLKYLKDKYEMVILTDWYAEQQIKRLEKVDIMKYFSNVYSAEKTKRKPFKEAFIQAIEENKPEECIIIGDNFERDIKGALNAGLQAVYYNPNNKVNILENKEYYEISDLGELVKIL